jgi:hypothetical protein
VNRFRRRLFNGIVALSAGLCVGSLAVWAASWQNAHSIRYSSSVGEIFVLTEGGLVQVDVVRGDTEDRGVSVDDYRRFGDWGWYTLRIFGPRAGLPRYLCALGFWGEEYTRDIGGDFLPPPSAQLRALQFFFPIWVATAISLIVPIALLFVRYRSVRRNRADHCVHCGYDLRATPDRCPECGTPREPQNRGPETTHA